MTKKQIIKQENRISAAAACIADILQTRNAQNVIFVTDFPSSAICDAVVRNMNGKKSTVCGFEVVQIESA